MGSMDPLTTLPPDEEELKEIRQWVLRMHKKMCDLRDRNELPPSRNMFKLCSQILELCNMTERDPQMYNTRHVGQLRQCADQLKEAIAELERILEL